MWEKENQSLGRPDEGLNCSSGKGGGKEEADLGELGVNAMLPSNELGVCLKEEWKEVPVSGLNCWSGH